jgi:excisionase family DNA binding protein
MTATPIPLFGDEAPDEAPARPRRRSRADAAAPAPAPAPREPDRLLTATEAAALLGIGRSKLYELMARGAIPSVKVDRCRRFRQSDVDRFINSLPVAAN